MGSSSLPIQPAVALPTSIGLTLPPPASSAASHQQPVSPNNVFPLSRTGSPAPLKIRVDIFQTTILRTILKIKERLCDTKDYLSTMEGETVDIEPLLYLKTVLLLCDKNKTETALSDMQSIQTIQHRLDEMWMEIEEKDSISAILPLAKTIYQMQQYLILPPILENNVRTHQPATRTTAPAEVANAAPATTANPTATTTASSSSPTPSSPKAKFFKESRRRDISLSDLLSVLGESEQILSGSLRKEETNETFHFVLSSKSLSYYKSSQAMLAKKTIDLADLTKVLAINRSTSGAGYLIQLQTKTKSYHFLADDEETRDQWISSISNHCPPSRT